MQRRHRLKKSAEFQRVRALKRSWAHPLLVLYVAPNDLALTRVGISTSKRVGKAVVRNRVKRLIREAVRSCLPSLPAGRDLVLIARPATAEAGFDQVRQAVESLLRRARLLPQQQQEAPRERDQARDAMDNTDPKVDRIVAD
jgi:ribonuclease P protein component